MKKVLLSVIMLVLALGGAGAQSEKYLGGDISLLPAYLEQGTVYRDIKGKKIRQPLQFFRGQGWNAMRVRLFVDPANAGDEHKDEGVCQDLDYVLKLSRQIKDAGFKLMLDFHYSDTWADPGKQFTPKRWESTGSVYLNDTVYQYTKHSLEAMVAAGAAPDMIQIGNEITFGMLWPTAKVDPYSPDNWPLLCSLLRNAAKACREVCPQAQIIIHTEHAGDTQATLNYYNYMKMYGVDYDVIGLSYYPMWHERIPVLAQTLGKLELYFPDKPVMIVEAAFYYSHKNDRWAKSSDEFSEFYPISIEGQRLFTQELVAELNRHSNVTGLFWWFPEENGYKNKVIKSWINRGLFNNENGRALPALYEMSRFNIK